MDYPVTTYDLGAQPILSIRERAGRTDLPGMLQAAFAELFDRLGRLGVNPAGPPSVIYHEFTADGVDAEVCVPIRSAVPGRGRTTFRELPPMTVARTVHVGRYEDLDVAYTAVANWIEGHGLEPAGPVQERYLNGPGNSSTPSEYRTEVEIPIVHAAVAV